MINSHEQLQQEIDTVLENMQIKAYSPILLQLESFVNATCIIRWKSKYYQFVSWDLLENHSGSNGRCIHGKDLQT